MLAVAACIGLFLTVETFEHINFPQPILCSSRAAPSRNHVRNPVSKRLQIGEDERSFAGYDGIVDQEVELIVSHERLVFIHPVQARQLQYGARSTHARERLGSRFPGWFVENLQVKLVWLDTASRQAVNIAHLQVPGCRIEVGFRSRLPKLYRANQLEDNLVFVLPPIGSTSIGGEIAHLVRAPACAETKGDGQGFAFLNPLAHSDIPKDFIHIIVPSALKPLEFSNLKIRGGQVLYCFEVGSWRSISIPQLRVDFPTVGVIVLVDVISRKALQGILIGLRQYFLRLAEVHHGHHLADVLLLRSCGHQLPHLYLGDTLESVGDPDIRWVGEGILETIPEVVAQEEVGCLVIVRGPQVKFGLLGAALDIEAV